MGGWTSINPNYFGVNGVKTRGFHMVLTHSDDFRSLVSRVCAVDGALILSTTQATLVEQINSFLGLKVDEFEAGDGIFCGLRTIERKENEGL